MCYPQALTREKMLEYEYETSRHIESKQAQPKRIVERPREARRFCNHSRRHRWIDRSDQRSGDEVSVLWHGHDDDCHSHHPRCPDMAQDVRLAWSEMRRDSQTTDSMPF